MNPKKLYRKIKSKINTKIQFLLINPLEYFQDPHKVYLASADQFAGMEEICESESFPDCRHFYSVIGGLGGLNILAKLKNLESIIFFDINPFSIRVCQLIFELIKNSNNRDHFISLIYARQFDSQKFSIENQSIFYGLPISEELLKEVRIILGSDLYEIYNTVYIPYIQYPLSDLYSGFSVHCTRLPIFHDAQISDVMVYPFNSRKTLEKQKLSSVNSFFFGKGWLKNDDRFLKVKSFLLSTKVDIIEKSIFDLDPLPQSGLYSSNVFDGQEKEFERFINKFSWTLWYSQTSNYLKLDFIYPTDRIIPIIKVYGKGNKNAHYTCCLILNDILNLKTKKFLEIIQPHPSEAMKYGFRFYSGQYPISVAKFLDPDLTVKELIFTDIIGVHILLGGGCSIEDWKNVVIKALKMNKTLFIFEHRKACFDWLEEDVDQGKLLPEREIDSFLLSLSTYWKKYGAANKRGDDRDIRNLCWILHKDIT